MVVDVLRAYAERVQEVAEELLAASRQNRESLTALAGLEIDRALERVGLATAEEVRQLTDRIRELEATVRDLQDDVALQQRRSDGRSEGSTTSARRSPTKGSSKASPKRSAKSAAKPAAKVGAAKKSASSRTTKSPAKRTGKATPKGQATKDSTGSAGT